MKWTRVKTKKCKISTKDGLTGNRSHVTTGTNGTVGYVYPYHVDTNHLTIKTGVSSFGIVLLEVLSGRATLDSSQSPWERNLIIWALPNITMGAFLDGFLDTGMQECPTETLVHLGELAA
ncbi:protein kinase APK1A, chloroplastic [Artemisia annua]|uniref:Protein kinase APK1A, chloroplastic n=1 Tax=Artemisia annua TaxID=35608 RepID=A0A2U1N6G2_ARTAN|nr:protein kinase APK1A, chloroplastic [Artemisia annua]